MTEQSEALDDLDASLSNVATEIKKLVESIRGETDESLRLAVEYTADDYEIVFARGDIREQFPPAELEERAETLVMKGLGDPPQEGALYDFGELSATIRWYDTVTVAHIPIRDWSGVVFAFDRRESPLIDLVEEHLDE